MNTKEVVSSGSAASATQEGGDAQRRLRILQHSLGLPGGGAGRIYRNHFVTGPGSDDYADCEALVSIGLMHKRAGNEITGGDPCYTVTEAGIDEARRAPQPVAEASPAE